MEGGGAQTERIIQEARRVSDAMEQTFSQSKIALDASIEAARLDQRAWCSVTSEMSVSGTLGSVSDASVKITFKNSGHTPALNVRTGAGFVLTYAFPLPPDLSLPSVDGEAGSVAVIGSQATQEINPVLTAKSVNDFIAQHDEGDRPFYIYVVGVIKYDDVFKREHQTTFCYYIQAAIGQKITRFQIAPTRNSVD